MTHAVSRPARRPPSRLSRTQPDAQTSPAHAHGFRKHHSITPRTLEQAWTIPDSHRWTTLDLLFCTVSRPVLSLRRMPAILLQCFHLLPPSLALASPALSLLHCIILFFDGLLTFYASRRFTRARSCHIWIPRTFKHHIDQVRIVRAMHAIETSATPRSDIHGHRSKARLQLRRRRRSMTQVHQTSTRLSAVVEASRLRLGSDGPFV